VVAVMFIKGGAVEVVEDCDDVEVVEFEVVDSDDLGHPVVGYFVCAVMNKNFNFYLRRIGKTVYLYFDYR